jgi:hypothetical protein
MDLDPRATVACGRRDWTGASDLNPTARIAHERWRWRGVGGGRRRCAAAGGGATHGIELGGLGLVHTRYQDAARTTGKPTGAVRTAEAQQRRRSTRRRGSVRRRTPASDCGLCEARGQPQASPGCSSPPCAAPRRSHGDEATAAART